ncbi:MAG: hypothetical protein US63_C0001G0027 [Candidatus Moranbacteria bacterium GW2011_GWC2_37_8]|nr:MAG: hypothetical protein US63_C0001G0027 [Candidatus Moranbacteria bacterium GW2011_GWC2_37_8]KKQ63078.1 MAG: hypothetical protein US82_C0003G0027 [Parcubacteria group bacterium GW2011_GWC1_38_22]KKQ79731.1 MAG: hypothetical protein UT03_C0043G0011 [Candidatus Moranbacteria bacterium GW2011_GWD2_38_7]
MKKLKLDSDFIWILKTIKHISNANNGNAFEYLFDDVLTLEGAPAVRSIHEGTISQFEAMGVISAQEIGNALHDGVFKLEGFKIQILKSKFDEIQKELSIQKSAVKTYTSHFFDSKALIKINTQDIPLPAYANEHLLCRVMFEYMIGEPVDWSIIFEKMTGDEPKDKNKNSRMVRDTMHAVNERIHELAKTERDLFEWKNKCIKRLF